MALAARGGSGALWQMSRAEREEGWRDEGHAFVGREVVRSTSATAQSVGTLYCWLPPTVEDCYEDEDGKPAPLFKVRFLVGELDGDVEDLDIRQVVESMVTESVLRPPAPAPPPKRPKPSPRPPSDDEDDDYDAAAPEPESSEDEVASDYEKDEAPRKPAAKKKRKADGDAPRKPAKKPAAPAPAPAPRVKAEPAPKPKRKKDVLDSSSDDEVAPPPRAKKPSASPVPPRAKKPSVAPKSSAERATARYAFEPLNADHLGLAAGANLEVWPTDESWWFARDQRGDEGRVPSGCVKVGPWREAAEDDNAPAAPAPPRAPKVKAEPAPAPVVPAPAPAPAPKKRRKKDILDTSSDEEIHGPPIDLAAVT